jgi:hypothetical protein
LYEALALAVWEMREIDYFLSREKWMQAVQHLAVRRLIWEDRGDNKVKVFLSEDNPTFNDYLSAAKNDVMELLTVLQMAQINESDHLIVRDKLDAASINLTEVIKTAKRLNTISTRKYPINEAQLQEIQKTYMD